MKSKIKTHYPSLTFFLFGIVCLLLGTFLGFRYFVQIHHRPLPHRVQNQEISIEGWMTLHYIAHVYRISLPVLFNKLNIEDTAKNENMSLDTLAKNNGIPNSEFLAKVKEALTQ